MGYTYFCRYFEVRIDRYRLIVINSRITFLGTDIASRELISQSRMSLGNAICSTLFLVSYVTGTSSVRIHAFFFSMKEYFIIHTTPVSSFLCCTFLRHFQSIFGHVEHTTHGLADVARKYLLVHSLHEQKADSTIIRHDKKYLIMHFKPKIMS